MTDKVRGLFVLFGFLLLAVVAFVAARHWQASQAHYMRVDQPSGCDLHATACRQTVAGGQLTFAIEPREIPLMQPLKLTVQIDGLAVRDVVVEIRGRNMEMGLNRTRLSETAVGRWEGETILPVCSQRRMEWEAAVRIDADGRYEVPFPFRTMRP